MSMNLVYLKPFGLLDFTFLSSQFTLGFHSLATKNLLIIKSLFYNKTDQSDISKYPESAAPQTHYSTKAVDKTGLNYENQFYWNSGN